MRKALTIAGVICLVAGCGLAGETVTANRDEITISVARVGQGNAGRTARDHCAQYGRDASLVGTDGGVMRFRCTPR